MKMMLTRRLQLLLRARSAFSVQSEQVVISVHTRLPFCVISSG